MAGQQVLNYSINRPTNTVCGFQLFSITCSKASSSRTGKKGSNESDAEGREWRQQRQKETTTFIYPEAVTRGQKLLRIRHCQSKIIPPHWSLCTSEINNTGLYRPSERAGSCAKSSYSESCCCCGVKGCNSTVRGFTFILRGVHSTCSGASCTDWNEKEQSPIIDMNFKTSLSAWSGAEHGGVRGITHGECDHR